MKPTCLCLEVFDSKGKVYPSVPVWHNCYYIRRRNDLIPEGERIATEMATTPDGQFDPAIFTEAFSLTMDRLAKQYDLV